MSERWRDLRPLQPTEVAGQLRDLGVARDGVLLAHVSYRAVRPIDGGPAGLVMALLEAIGSGGTLVMPSFTGDDEHPFDPARTPAYPDLGVTTETFRLEFGPRRSRHYDAVVALGPQAAFVTDDPFAVPPHGPGSNIDRVRQLDGQVLLLGCGHGSNTTIHLGEALGGAPYGVPRRVTLREGDRLRRLEYREPDHCCERFALMDDWLRAAGLQMEGPVAYGHARLARSRDIARLAAEHVRAEPLVFLHAPSAGCQDCNLARASVPERA